MYRTLPVSRTVVPLIALVALSMFIGVPRRGAALTSGTDHATTRLLAQSTDIVDWDAKPGYTVVLSSELREDRALQIMRTARAEGINAGVLWSTGFSSLRPGYWVVYAGRFSDVRNATAAQAQLRARGYKTAYARFVRR